MTATTTAPRDRADFRTFCTDVFPTEHRHPTNIALHVAGVLASAALVVWAVVAGPLWLALLYPVVHVVPGLVGHRLFERDAAVGDLRIGRRDYPGLWFIAANHRLTWRVLTGRRP